MVTYFQTVRSAIVLGTLATAIASGLPAYANGANGAAALQDFNGQQSVDPFSSRGDGTSNVMQMIHRVMRGDANVDPMEVRAAQQENLSTATSDFFAKQRERLQPGNSLQNPVNSALPPSGQLGTLVPQAGSSALLLTVPKVGTPTLSPLQPLSIQQPTTPIVDPLSPSVP